MNEHERLGFGHIHLGIDRDRNQCLVLSAEPAETNCRFQLLRGRQSGGGMCIVIPVTITNLGARGTTITDVGLIETCGDQHCFLGSWYTLKSGTLEAFFKSRPKDDEPSPYIDKTNSAYYIAGKSEITNTFVFHPRDEQSIPAITDNALCIYRVKVHSRQGEWYGDSTVSFPADADKTVMTDGKALLVNVQESIIWQHSQMEEMQTMRYAPPARIVPVTTLGPYSPHARIDVKPPGSDEAPKT